MCAATRTFCVAHMQFTQASTSAADSTVRRERCSVHLEYGAPASCSRCVGGRCVGGTGVRTQFEKVVAAHFVRQYGVAPFARGGCRAGCGGRYSAGLNVSSGCKAGSAASTRDCGSATTSGGTVTRDCGSAREHSQRHVILSSQIKAAQTSQRCPGFVQ